MECSAEELREEEDEPRISPLVYTSLLLTTNVATAYMTAQYYYAFLFAVLTLTSVMVHLEDEPVINAIDKMVIVAVVVKGSTLLYSNYQNMRPLVLLITIATFSYCVLTYYLGAVLKRGCSDPDSNVSERWHMGMHVLGSFGHHLIALSSYHQGP